jgi:hypothetical protein
VNSEIKMADTDEQNTLLDGGICEKTAFSVLDMFLDHLEIMIGEKDGPLSIADARALAEQVKNSDAQETFNEFRERLAELIDDHDQELWNKTRKRPFDRILAKKFSHLFPAEGELDSRSDRISRRALPGFFLAIEKMDGPELYDKCQSACRGLVKAERAKKGNAFRWKDLYDNPEATAMVNDVFALVSTYFNDFEKRCSWLQTLINSNLASFEDYAFEGDAGEHWTLSEKGIHLLLEAMFSDFREVLSLEDGEEQLCKRYGEKAYIALVHVLEDLDNVQGAP